MPNTYAPFGFRQSAGTGSSPTYEQVTRAISSSNATPIFFGDPVTNATNTTGIGTGYIQQAAVSVQTISITGGTLTAGVLTLAFSATTAPPVGAVVVVAGGTSTAATANGAWLITAATTTSLSFNFPGAYTTGTATAYVFVPVAGVFTGCTYISVSQKRRVWGNYYPGSDANGDVTGYVCTDPNAQFYVQTGNSNTTATAVGLSSVGQNIGFNYSQSGVTSTNGNTANGLSTYFADQYTLSANFPAGYAGNPFLPFRILGLASSAIGSQSILSNQNGYDTTTAYNWIVVGFNNAVSNQLAAI